jgi:23S rRNA (adenine2503-C2)-methyltransferase
VAALADGALIEYAEAIQPPLPREQKWVLIVSTLRGCPVACPICDAGGDYRGKLSADEIWAQIEDLVRRRHPDLKVPVPKFKIQFARMGDPAVNDAVLEVLRFLPLRLRAPGLLPSISTIAPAGRDAFFDDLLALKQELYPGGRFQMQFSLHSTCQEARRRLVPTRTWTFAQMAAYGRRFFAPGDRKLTLNFAPALGFPLAPSQLLEHFDPAIFTVKLTPINPTAAATRAGLVGLLDPADPAACEALAQSFRAVGYDTILSIGDLSENQIGSNCGMLARVLEHEA